MTSDYPEIEPDPYPKKWKCWYSNFVFLLLNSHDRNLFCCYFLTKAPLLLVKQASNISNEIMKNWPLCYSIVVQVQWESGSKQCVWHGKGEVTTTLQATVRCMFIALSSIEHVAKLQWNETVLSCVTYQKFTICVLDKPFLLIKSKYLEYWYSGHC